MEGLSDFRREFVRAIYEQHWQQIRSHQRERFWLVVIFSSVFASGLVVLRGELGQTANWPAVALFMVLALLGLFMSIKMQIAIKAHLSATELILSRYGLDHYLPRYRPSLTRRLVRISRMVSKFFLFCFCLFLGVLLFISSHNWQLSGFIVLILYVVLAFVVYFAKYDSPQPRERE